jgi:hypothetical protein
MRGMRRFMGWSVDSVAVGLLQASYEWPDG